MRRRRTEHASGPGGDPVGEFWRWWTTSGADDLARRFDTRQVAGVVELVAPRVAAIDPRLSWEFGPGGTSRHCLVVTAAGDPEVRAVARRWRRAAPQADDVWSFADVRPPARGAVAFEMAGATVDAASATYVSRPEAGGLGVRVHHPAFGGLGERERLRATYLLLDGLLGEATVELWLSTIEAADAGGRQPLTSLPEEVRHVVEAGTGDDGELRWVVLRGQGPDGPVVVTRRLRLSSVQSPAHDEHLVVEVPYADRTEDGLPGERSADRLSGLEAHLTERLGGSGLLVAVESSAGRRALHFYVDSTTPAAGQAEAAVSGWDEGEVTMAATYDPAWSRVGHLR